MNLYAALRIDSPMAMVNDGAPWLPQLAQTHLRDASAKRRVLSAEVEVWNRKVVIKKRIMSRCGESLTRVESLDVREVLEVRKLREE